MKYPSRETVEGIRKKYPAGTRVELVRMDDAQAPPIGTKGTVKGVDDTGSLLMRWDNGSSLNDVLRRTNTWILWPFVDVQTTLRPVIPLAMSRLRLLSSTVPSNILKTSPLIFSRIVWGSATLSMVCFSSIRPQSFSA